MLLADDALAGPAAIVESVADGSAGLRRFEYLAPPRVLSLAPGVRVVINYLRSCIRETITGGTVAIGQNESRVSGGSVRRDKVECDGHAGETIGQIDQNAQPPGFIAPIRPEGQPHETGVQRTIYSTAPLFDLGGPGRLVIQPLDPPGPAQTVTVTAAALIGGRFYDSASGGQSLQPGALYRASAHGHDVVFWVDPLAQSGAGPPAGRLIRL